MKNLIVVSSITLLIASLASCAGPKERACSEYEQAKQNAEATVSLAKQLTIQGKLSSQELIKVDQEAGLYSKRLRDLCVFLEEKRISYQEYDSGVTKANQDYQKLRELVTSAQNRP